MRFCEVNFNKFSLPAPLNARCLLQFATRSAGDKTIDGSDAMNSRRDLRFWCCLWLCLTLYGQVLCQDISPELPEDFTTSTAAAETATTTTAVPATTATTTSEAAPTTSTAASTLTTAEAAPTTTYPPPAYTPPTYTTPSSYLPTRQPTLPPTTRPFYYPTYAPPSSPPVPAYTPSYHWLWDLDNSGQQSCYLKDHVERSYYRWSCGSEYL